MNPKGFRKSVMFTMKTEKKFFSLLKILIIPDHVDDCRKYKQTIDNYGTHIMNERPDDDGSEEAKHFNEIINKIKLIQKNVIV